MSQHRGAKGQNILAVKRKRPSKEDQAKMMQIARNRLRPKKVA